MSYRQRGKKIVIDSTMLIDLTKNKEKGRGKRTADLICLNLRLLSAPLNSFHIYQYYASPHFTFLSHLDLDCVEIFVKVIITSMMLLQQFY